MSFGPSTFSQSTNKQSFNFGSTSGFGAPASSASTGFSGFGGSGSSNGQTGFFSSGNTSSTGSGFSFGQPVSSSGGFGFGNNASNTQQSGFGFGTSKSTTSGTAGTFNFGGGGTSAVSGSGNTGFGSGSTGFGSSSTGFGVGSTGFGSGSNTATSFGTGGTGFGTGLNTSGFGSSTGLGGSTFGSSSSGFGSANTGFSNTGSTFGNTSAGFGSGFGTGSSGFSTGIGGFGTGGCGFGTGNTGFGTGTTGFGTGSGGFGSTNTGFGSSSTGGLFGGGLKTSQPSTLNFGLGSNTFKSFGVGPTSAQQQGVLSPSVALYLAVCAPAYFNDERDEVLKKWNQLQAVWGTGKGFYVSGMPPVEFTPDNEFCRFKAVGYIKMPTFTPDEGLVEIVISKKDTIVREQQTGLVAELCKLYGGNVQVCVEYVRPGPGDNKTRLCYYVQHRSPNGETKKANTWDVYNHLKSEQHRQSVTNMCIESATPLVSLTEAQLKEYLDKPPRGLDLGIWEQGKKDNPDPSKYLPVPLVGFQELQARFRAQEIESNLLQGQLDKIAEDVFGVQTRQATLLDQLAECNRKQRAMAHRILQVVVRQECQRKRGVPVTAAEEQLRIKLEALHAQLRAPTQYMSKVNELFSQVSEQSTGGVSNASNGLSSDTERDVRTLLSWQQDSISEVVAVLKNDMKAFDAMIASRSK